VGCWTLHDDWRTAQQRAVRDQLHVSLRKACQHELVQQPEIAETVLQLSPTECQGHDVWTGVRSQYASPSDPRFRQYFTELKKNPEQLEALLNSGQSSYFISLCFWDFIFLLPLHLSSSSRFESDVLDSVLFLHLFGRRRSSRVHLPLLHQHQKRVDNWQEVATQGLS
jgi:hypothetical protein